MLKPALLVVPALAGLLLSGCSTAAPDNAGDGVINVVASTNVYGAIAHAIGGSHIDVTSIIDKADQDPHEFEGSGRVQLALSRADIVIVNGGGYDDFASTMLTASGNTGARVIDAVKLSGKDATVDDFNEHVFYDYPTMLTVSKAIAAALDIADPDNAAYFDGHAEGFAAQLSALEAQESAIASIARGAGVVITEPVPLYALQAAGLTNLTPAAFSEAVENDTDAPPAVVQAVLDEFADGSVAVLVYNAQTGGPQTDAVIAAASDAGVPAIGVTETLGDADDYFDWQSGFLEKLTEALLPKATQ